jgi:hypothetical protein
MTLEEGLAAHLDLSQGEWKMHYAWDIRKDIDRGVADCVRHLLLILILLFS